MRWPRTFVVALPVAALSEAVGWRDIEPDALAALLYVVSGLSLIALGVVAMWRGIVAFVPWFLLIAAVEEAWVYKAPSYECDPFCASPLALWFLALPAYLLVIGAGILVRRIAARRRAQGDVMPTPP